ncbi:MAG: bifunctional chorismate mutase/prephenate dehydratase [Christensenellales bacterium]
MGLSELRVGIDEADKGLVEAFARRMALTDDIARLKAEEKLPIHDPARERAKLQALGELVPADYAGYTQRLYQMIFELSRSRQRQLTGGANPLQAKILEALEKTPKLFPERPLVACQGVEGAYSQSATEKLFTAPNIMYFDSFEGVFRAVDQGFCRFGVLPLENSTAGSVNRIYDLMMRYDVSLVRSTRVKVDHCLLAPAGTARGQIREIVSHEQALQQSEGFLKSLGNIKITVCENTALAAKLVFESGRRDLAALSSRSCAELYGLEVLQSSVQDSASNFTRFICISKQLEIYPGADKTSIMMVLPHKPGSLYNVLGRFYALGINLIKLESRPLPNSDFEFMFYFDLETSVYSPEFLRIFDEIEGMAISFKYLGSYLEAV